MRDRPTHGAANEPAPSVRLVAAADLADPQPGTRVVELTGVSNEPSFHDQIAAALDFPGYYGRNLDALWDCLTDLTEPVELRWFGWMSFAVGQPAAWARMLGVLTERAAAPGFTLVCVT